MNKIKEKLTGHSSSSNDDTNKLSKNDYDSYGSNTTGNTSSTTSKLQNPISSSGGTHGTYANETQPSSYPQQSSGYTSTASDRMPEGYSGHNQTGSYPQHSDQYGNEHTSLKDKIPGMHSKNQESSGYSQHSGGYNSNTSDRMPGSYDNDDRYANTPSTARQPYDPYSSKGQETAARAGTTGYGSSQAQNYSRPTGEESISRTRDGGVMNQYSDQRHDGHHTSSRDNESSSHYGRDAAMAGGAGAVGAGGVGAYEMNKHQSSSQPLTSGQQHNVQHMDRDTHPMGSAGHGTAMAGGQSSGTNTDSPGMTQAKKMGGAYEAGYKDAMEHMQAEMRQKGSGTGF